MAGFQLAMYVCMYVPDNHTKCLVGNVVHAIGRIQAVYSNILEYMWLSTITNYKYNIIIIYMLILHLPY